MIFAQILAYVKKKAVILRAKLFMSMKIDSVHIAQLYEQYNFHWENLDPQVNLIAGINGSFKTTIINILNDILNVREPNYPLSDVIIKLNDGSSVDYYNAPLSLSQVGPTEKERRWFAEQLVGTDLGNMTDQEIGNLSTNISRYHILRGTSKIDQAEYKKNL